MVPHMSRLKPPLAWYRAADSAAFSWACEGRPVHGDGSSAANTLAVDSAMTAPRVQGRRRRARLMMRFSGGVYWSAAGERTGRVDAPTNHPCRAGEPAPLVSARCWQAGGC